MSKTIKLSKEELEILQGYQQKQNQITFNLGSIDIQKALLEGQRGAILESTDWTQVGDSALDSTTKTAWATYRTKIRDIPSTYSSTEPKLIKFATNGNVEIGKGLEEGTLNVTGASVVITSP